MIATASSPFETYESSKITSEVESGSNPSVFGASFGERMWMRRAVSRLPSTGWIVQKAELRNVVSRSSMSVQRRQEKSGGRVYFSSLAMWRAHQKAPEPSMVPFSPPIVRFCTS